MKFDNYYMLSFSNIMHFLLFDNFDKPEMKLFYQIWYNFGKLRPQIDPSFPSWWGQKPKLLKMVGRAHILSAKSINNVFARILVSQCCFLSTKGLILVKYDPN